MFACVEFGTYQNPCRCKIVGPTLGAVMGIVSAVVLWPVGAAVYVCSRPGGRSLFRTPGVVYSRVATPIPI